MKCIRMTSKSQKDKQSSSINTPAESLIQALADTSISLKDDNPGSIALTYNFIYHA